jgi:hypothetical protein
MGGKNRRAVLVAALGCAAPLASVSAARADFLISNKNHSQTLKNNTGATANDLHVNLIHPATGNAPTAPPFSPGATGGTTVDFSGGSVGPGGSATVNWQSKFSSDTLDPTNPGNWTFNNANIGNATSVAVGLTPSYQNLGGGQVRVALVNSTGAPLSYNNLRLANNANSALFGTAAYVSGLSTGASVPLMVPGSGTLAVGTTNIADFFPTQSPSEYSGGAVSLGSDGELWAHAASNVPEPGAIAALATAAVLISPRRPRPAARTVRGAA